MWQYCLLITEIAVEHTREFPRILISCIHSPWIISCNTEVCWEICYYYYWYFAILQKCLIKFIVSNSSVVSMTFNSCHWNCRFFKGSMWNFSLQKVTLFTKSICLNNALRLIYQPLEMGERSAAAPKIGVQESNICIAFTRMDVIFYVGVCIGSTASPDRNEESRV
jgi:hypothetical protein